MAAKTVLPFAFWERQQPWNRAVPKPKKTLGKNPQKEKPTNFLSKFADFLGSG